MKKWCEKSKSKCPLCFSAFPGGAERGGKKKKERKKKNGGKEIAWNGMSKFKNDDNNNLTSGHSPLVGLVVSAWCCHAEKDQL